jgi:IclR family transcriptional regulator, KDG regulon repressor
MAGTGVSKVQSVEHALDVLEQVAFAGEELGVTQLAARLALTKGSVHRHLVTLVERGYLAQNPVTARYGPGPRCKLLMGSVGEPDLMRAAEDPMRDLRDELGHSVVLSSMSPRGALVIGTAASASPIEIGVRPGSTLSFHASAQGRVLLAFAPERLKQRVLSAAMEPFTEKTVIDRAEIAAELTRIVQRGYGTSPEQVLLGINAVAAPVFGAEGSCVGAVALVGSIQYLPAQPLRNVIRALVSTAQQISRRMGHKLPGESDAIRPPTRPRKRLTKAV